MEPGVAQELVVHAAEREEELPDGHVRGLHRDLEQDVPGGAAAVEPGQGGWVRFSELESGKVRKSGASVMIRRMLRGQAWKVAPES